MANSPKQPSTRRGDEPVDSKNRDHDDASGEIDDHDRDRAPSMREDTEDSAEPSIQVQRDLEIESDDDDVEEIDLDDLAAMEGPDV